MSTEQGGSICPAISPDVPRFRDLPTLPESTERHAWDVWGRDDELGCINFIGPDQIRSACSSVEEGLVISLSAAVNDTDPGLFPRRRRADHTVLPTSHGRDDKLDNFFPQFSSQWDGLRHVRYRSHYWGGRSENQLDVSDVLGIQVWAGHGIIGRGVLIDVIGFMSSRGEHLDPQSPVIIDAEFLDAVLAAQGSTIAEGDIVMVRTGWMDWYLHLDRGIRASFLGTVGARLHPFSCPGLSPDQSTAAWLWDHRASAIVADNPAVEVMPVSRAAGFLHYRLIPLLGMALGEMWVLSELARACRRLGRYHFLLSGGVLKVRGGVASPASAHAVL